MAESRQQNQDYKKYLFQYNSTPEQRKESARHAAQVRAEKNKQYKLQREILKQILMLDCDDPEAVEKLQELGLEPDFANAANLAVIHRALRGDVEAMRYIRDTVGEKPADTTRLDVLSKPVGAQDLSQLTDAELEMLADRAEKQDALPPTKTAAALLEPVTPEVAYADTEDQA